MAQGKNSSAKKNVSAEGKQLKTEKKNVGDGRKEPPFMCAIYRRDIASFLSREQVQHWRLTSSHSNAPLSKCSSLLTRFKHHSLTVIFASSNRCITQKNGFLDRRTDSYSMDGEEFQSIDDLCCEVEDSPSELVGQRLFPQKPHNEGVAFRLCLNPGTWRSKMVVCRVQNLLTEETAPVMLRFLHHISLDCYQHIEIIPGSTTSAAECAFNPLVLQALPKFRLRCAKFGRAGSWAAELSSLTVEMAFKMRIRYNLLSYYTYNFLGPQLPRLLEFIANGRQLKKRLVSDAFIRSQDVDQTINHFVEDVPSLEGAIRDVRCVNPYNYADIWTNWPARCPREAATQVTERDDGSVDYHFNYSNAHSGEVFSVLLVLVAHSDEGRTKIHRFELKFGSA